MARTSFYRLARSSLLPPAAAAAAAAATTALAASTFADEKGGSDDGRRGVGVGGSPTPRSLAAFARRPRGATICEAPHRPSSSSSSSSSSRDANAAVYLPADPAEPDLAPDGRGSKGGMMWGEERDGSFHGLFPRRQLWRPAVEYPLWDYNWDGRQPPPPPISRADGGGDDGKMAEEAKQRERLVRKEGVTRHVILIRHGQYDETSKEDSKRLLTSLGRKQAELTGRRLGGLVRGISEEFGPCRVRVIRVSDLARAKETADIIYESMDLGSSFGGEEVVGRAEPDPLLNEGRPCHHIPGGVARPSVVERTDEQHPRIEEAFRKYFYRADVPGGLSSSGGGGEGDADADADAAGGASGSGGGEAPPRGLQPHPQHEFEVIVCHANVIRYFFCRALQLPPEAWLRLCTFNCSLTYFTIRPTGTVSCRMLGDIGHLPHELCTFSMHSGFNW